MAEIDFTNATITAIGPALGKNNLGLNDRPYAPNKSYTEWGSYEMVAVSPTKKEFTYMGTVTASGNKIGIGAGDNQLWEIGNINYQNGDIFSFTVAVEVP